MSRCISSAFIGGVSLALTLGAGVLGAPTAHAAPCSANPVASGTGAATIYTVTFTTVGVCEWTPPSGVVQVDVLLVAGGGGGGGGEAAGTGGGGGGAGAEARVLAGVNVANGVPVAIAVGDGGLGGLAGSPGITGAPSSVTRGTTVDSANAGGSGYPGGDGGVVGHGGSGGGGSGGGGASAASGGGGGAGAGQGGGGAAATDANGAAGTASAVVASIPADSLFAGWADVYGASGGGGGGSGSATGGLGGTGGGGAGGGSGSAGSTGGPNTGAGGGGGGRASAGGKGGSGLVIIKYQVASVSPSTLTINATVGQPITPTTFTLHGVGAPSGQWCESDPGTNDGIDSYELVPGIKLNESTCVLSGTPSVVASTGTFVVLGGAARGDIPVGGRSTVTLTVSASGGGSGGGGGSSTSPEATPTPAPTPSSLAPISVAPERKPLDPVPPGSTASIPATGLGPGQSALLLDGVSESVTTRSSAIGDVAAVEMTGASFSVSVSARSRRGTATPEVTGMSFAPGSSAVIQGSGYESNSEIRFFIFSAATDLGTLTTDDEGRVRGDIPMPVGIAPGSHTFQMVGYSPEGLVRVLSLGVLITTDKAPSKTRTAKATVYFDALSSALTSSAKASLRALVKGRAASATRTLVLGYVQDSGLTSNNQTLSSQRAKAIAAYLRELGLKGAVVTRGDGVARESGAAGRKAVVEIRYSR